MHRTYCICSILLCVHFQCIDTVLKKQIQDATSRTLFFSKLQCLYLILSFEFFIHQAVSTKNLSRNCPFQSETAVSGRDPFRKLSVPVAETVVSHLDFFGKLPFLDGNCCFWRDSFRKLPFPVGNFCFQSGCFQETVEQLAPRVYVFNWTETRSCICYRYICRQS
jgi:hypothetical protein